LLDNFFALIVAWWPLLQLCLGLGLLHAVKFGILKEQAKAQNVFVLPLGKSV
jgi:hypothetical protein